jgi:DNA-binding SARP family transcriptional activator
VSAVTVVRQRRPAAWMPVLGHLCRDLMNGAPRHFNLPIAPRIEYNKSVTRLDNALGERLGEAPALLPAKAWEALRALITEHRRLTLWRLAMQAETQLGLRESVARRYQRLLTLLDTQLGLQPETATRTLYRDILGQR